MSHKTWKAKGMGLTPRLPHPPQLGRAAAAEEVAAAHALCPVLKTMWPQQAGAIKLARRYGDALVCVRYRCDATGSTRYTTVELVVEETPTLRRPPQIVAMAIPWDAELRARARALGAQWNPVERVWTMTRRVARALRADPAIVTKNQPKP